MVFGSGGGGTNERGWGREGGSKEGRKEGAPSFTHDTRLQSARVIKLPFSVGMTAYTRNHLNCQIIMNQQGVC